MIHQRMDILGVPVDALDMHSALSVVRRMLDGQKTNLVLAVNPEKIMAAQRDHALLTVLKEADLLIPDGIGAVLAARLLHRAVLSRVPGSELMPEICRMVADTGHSVFLYGAKPEVIEQAAGVLSDTYPRLIIAGIRHGYVSDAEMDGLIEDINASGASVLFVGTGSPRQEFWMARYRDRLSVRVCQGVGGTFDALCGNPPRAPTLVRKLQLEWLYRLISQPQRMHRQKALPTFAAQVLRAWADKE